MDHAEVRIGEELFDEMGGFLNIVSSSSNCQQRLPEALRHVAQTVLGQEFKKISVDRVIADNKISSDLLRSWVNEQLKHAQPNLSDCGGGVRLMLGLPRLSGESMLPELVSESFATPLTAVFGTTGDVAFCLEAEGIALGQRCLSIAGIKSRRGRIG